MDYSDLEYIWSLIQVCSMIENNNKTYARDMNTSMFLACARWENEMRLVNYILEWTFVGAGM